MRTATKNKNKFVLTLMFTIIIILTLVVVVLVAALMKRPAEEIDPHEGQVYINDGFGMVWMTPLEGVDVNNISQSDIVRYDGVPKYVGEGYETLRGVDVSEHQYDIDWAAVAASGVDFAYIRLGYRGYTQGGLFEDAYFKANIEGAKSNGIKVGVYFFSQAINVQEAIEEADFVLERIEQYDIDLPVMYDWEKMEEAGADARTYQLDTAILDECAVAFCETVKKAGYEPGVYFNRYIGYYGFDLSRLNSYKFWLAVPGDFPDFYYAFDIWQYSFEETIPGSETPPDMNLMFIPKVQPSPSPSAEATPAA